MPCRSVCKIARRGRLCIRGKRAWNSLELRGFGLSKVLLKKKAIQKAQRFRNNTALAKTAVDCRGRCVQIALNR